MARYARSAGKDVKSAMRRRKKGTLKSGKGGKGGTGQEPQAGDRHRPVRGAQEGQEGAAAPDRAEEEVMKPPRPIDHEQALEEERLHPGSEAAAVPQPHPAHAAATRRRCRARTPTSKG